MVALYISTYLASSASLILLSVVVIDRVVVNWVASAKSRAIGSSKKYVLKDCVLVPNHRTLETFS